MPEPVSPMAPLDASKMETLAGMVDDGFRVKAVSSTGSELVLSLTDGESGRKVRLDRAEVRAMIDAGLVDELAPRAPDAARSDEVLDPILA